MTTHQIRLPKLSLIRRFTGDNFSAKFVAIDLNVLFYRRSWGLSKRTSKRLQPCQYVRGF